MTSQATEAATAAHSQRINKSNSQSRIKSLAIGCIISIIFTVNSRRNGIMAQETFLDYVFLLSLVHSPYSHFNGQIQIICSTDLN